MFTFVPSHNSLIPQHFQTFLRTIDISTPWQHSIREVSLSKALESERTVFKPSHALEKRNGTPSANQCLLKPNQDTMFTPTFLPSPSPLSAHTEPNLSSTLPEVKPQDESLFMSILALSG